MPLGAQEIRVFSEFRRLDAKGEFVEADRGGSPREILSPAMARNAYHSFHLVVRAPEKRQYVLHLAQNPENTVEFKLYREHPASDSHVLDRLEDVKLPAKGKGGDADVYLLDVFVPPDAKAGRIRLEAQIHDGDAWVIYPMEIRILPAVVSQITMIGVQLPQVAESSAQTARSALHEFVCGGEPASAAIALTVRQIIRRNALQDISLARELQTKQGRDVLLAKLMKVLEFSDANYFCGIGSVHSPLGPEWYLKVRDFLYRESSH